MDLHGMRLLRRGLAALIVAVLVWVAIDYARTWRSRVRSIQQTGRMLGSDLIRAAESIEYSEHENGKLRFKIHARRLVETRQGKSLLEGIEALDFNPDGTPKSRIRSLKAEYDRDRGQALFSGDVQIQMGKDIALSSESLFYDLKDGYGQTDGIMHLSSPQAEGSARGVRYDQAHGILDLAGEIVLHITRKLGRESTAAVEQKSRVTSKSLHYSEQEQLVRFIGDARMDTSDAALSGDLIEARLSPGARRIESLTTRGHAEYSTKATDGGRLIRGERIDFGINPQGKALERIDVHGDASLTAKSEGGEFTLSAGEIHLELDPAEASLQRIRSRSSVEFRHARAGGDTRLSGQSLEAEFAAETGLLRSLQVREQASMGMTAGGRDASGDELRADQIRIDFAESAGPSRPQRIQADGSVRWKSEPGGGVPGRKPTPGRVLTAARLEMIYGSSGESLERGHADGGVQIAVLPAQGSPDSLIRRLESNRVRFTFYPAGSRIKTLEGDGGVRVFYAGAAEPGPSAAGGSFETWSEEMRALFREADGAAETLSQWGGFTYKDGGRTARSGRGDYSAATQVLVLQESPEVSDAGSTTTGETLEYRLKDKMMVMKGNVRSLVRPAEADTGSPFLSSSGSSSPTIVTAKLMRYWSQESRIEYDTSVQMLSEGGQLQADVVDVRNSGAELEARGRVRHLMLPRRAGAAKKTGAGDPATSRPGPSGGETTLLVRSHQLRFVKGEGTIRYTGDVVLESGDIRMWSDRLDAMLDPEGKRVDWAKADGSLRIRQVGREARGEQAEYFFAPGKFVVLGKPAEMSDPERGRSAARRLTFFTSDDRILLENS